MQQREEHTSGVDAAALLLGGGRVLGPAPSLGLPSTCPRRYSHPHVTDDVLGDWRCQEGRQHLKRMQEGVRLVVVIPAPVATAGRGRGSDKGAGRWSLGGEAQARLSKPTPAPHFHPQAEAGAQP